MDLQSAPGAEERDANIVQASPDYFPTLGVSLVAGRVYSSDVRRNEIVANGT